jgi:predicted CXXCH cytochrome family protein
MKKTEFSFRHFWVICLILLPALIWVFSSPHVATAGYADSAHGNASYGIDRSTPACQYPNPSPPPDLLECPTGSCAHCHDTFDSGICGVNTLMLFAANSADFCFGCHDNTTDPATTAIVNRSYSYRAGGYSTDPVNDIDEAFLLASSHGLDDIKTFINGKWGYDANSNPCTACHNQHLAEGDPENAPDAAKSDTTRGWPVSRPSQHNVGTWGLWGDDTAERMSEYVADANDGDYQAPRRTPTTYEPDGSTTQDGSNLTDFNTFCTDCHNTTYTIYSTSLGRNLIQIDWENEVHGKGDPDDGLPDSAKLCGDPPYPSGGPLGHGKVLSCLDCHEPHGSPNVTLIRKRVNASTVSSITTISQDNCTSSMNINNEMSNLCNRCHNDDYQIDSGCSSGRWYKVHHKETGDTGCNTDSPYNAPAGGCSGSGCHYKTTMSFGCNVDVCYDLDDRTCFSRISCNCCHYHGSFVDEDTWNYPDFEPKYRRTF